MIRILQTGDLHIGRNYAGYDEGVAARYSSARMEALENVVSLSNSRNCNYLVIAGDLFENKRVKRQVREAVFNALAKSLATVIIIPGNHDYCTDDDDKFWKTNDELAAPNTVILKTFSPYSDNNNNAVFYPCFCDSGYSDNDNRLGWLKGERLSPDRLNIGIAHGAIEGLSCDNEGKYYSMSTKELADAGMDLWLVGHTHIAYKDIQNRVFNAGTHQQTDISDNSESTVFIIDIADDKKLSITCEHTGVIRFVRREIKIKHGEALGEVLERALPENPQNASCRFFLSGMVSEGDYHARREIYDKLRPKTIRLEVFDDELTAEITKSRIDGETLPSSVENRLLTEYLSSGEGELLALAFELICECKGENA